MGTRNPPEIFPLEVWKLIFEQLGGQPGSSTNLLNCSNVCTEFEEVLKPTQFTWLFESVCPLIFPYLKGKELLKCRGVCKEWCRVVDCFLEDFEGRNPFNKDTTSISKSFTGQYTLLEKKGLQTYLREPEKLSMFMEDMRNAKNPFIGGFLGLIKTDPESHPQLNIEPPRLDPVARQDGQILFWKEASKLLVKFGEHIKYIKMSDKSRSLNAKEFYVFLRQYLHFLPNLRSLCVFGGFSYFVERSTNSEENRRRLRQLNEFLERDSSSLPEISSLETIEILSFDFPRSICQKLISGINPRKLKCLKLCVKSSVEDTVMTFNEPLPSLSELHLLGIQSVEQLQNLLTNLVSEEAPLGKLVLSFDCNSLSSAPTGINFDLVSEAVSKFGRTLQVLSVVGLDSQRPLAELPVPSCVLKIPHVRSLGLESVMFGPGPGFLPPDFAQSLEYLTILISRLGEDIALSRTEGPEFYKGAIDGELCYSPIWSQMPKLKCIKVILPYFNKTITCTREMHKHGIRSEPLDIRHEEDFMGAFGIQVLCSCPDAFIKIFSNKSNQFL